MKRDEARRDRTVWYGVVWNGTALLMLCMYSMVSWWCGTVCVCIFLLLSYTWKFGVSPCSGRVVIFCREHVHRGSDHGCIRRGSAVQQVNRSHRWTNWHVRLRASFWCNRYFFLFPPFLCRSWPWKINLHICFAAHVHALHLLLFLSWGVRSATSADRRSPLFFI